VAVQSHAAGEVEPGLALPEVRRVLLMRWLRTTAGVIGWACLLAWLGGTLGAWDFHVCLKAPAGACSKPPNAAMNGGTPSVR